MIQAIISKKNNQQSIVAEGSIPEMMNDVAILISGIYNQFFATNPASAIQFRVGLTTMINAPDSPVWKPMGNQTGITFRMPDKEEEIDD